MYHQFIIYQSTYQQPNYTPQIKIRGGESPRPTVHEECATRNAHEVRMQGVAVNMRGRSCCRGGKGKDGEGRSTVTRMR